MTRRTRYETDTEGILAIIIAILSCIIFINIILRYGFHTSILSIDELSRLLFVWLTFYYAIVVYGQQPCAGYFFSRKLSPANQQRVSLLTHTLILLLCLQAGRAIENSARLEQLIVPIPASPLFNVRRRYPHRSDYRIAWNCVTYTGSSQIPQPKPTRSLTMTILIFIVSLLGLSPNWRSHRTGIIICAAFH
ncbi:hypothetical protein DMH88_06255 [Escherichia coli]|nr:hypothetical protein [Escherichia coli]